MTHRLCLIHQLSALLFGTWCGVWWNMLYLTAVMLAVGAGLNILFVDIIHLIESLHIHSPPNPTSSAFLPSPFFPDSSLLLNVWCPLKGNCGQPFARRQMQLLSLSSV